MVVITLTDVPQTLRGDLTKWLFEINVGVYVGQISARVRDELWNRIIENVKVGRVTMVYQTNNEQHFAYRVHNSAWKPIDFDGLMLMMRPNADTPQATRLRPGFSNAAHRRLARRIQEAELKKCKAKEGQIEDSCNENQEERVGNTSSDLSVTSEVVKEDVTNTDNAAMTSVLNGRDNFIYHHPEKSATSDIDLTYMMDSIKPCDVTPDISNDLNTEKVQIEQVNSIECKDCVMHPQVVSDIPLKDVNKCICNKNNEYKQGSKATHSTYVVIDLETTGLDEKECEIIEFGALRIIDGRIAERFQKLVLIENDIPPFITKLTGISDDMLDEEGEELNDVMDKFITFIGNDLLVAHNISFDIKFLNHALIRLGRPTISNRQKCTYEMSKLLLPSIKSRKLTSIAEELGINGSGKHRSISDCECVYRVYEQMLRMLEQRKR